MHVSEHTMVRLRIYFAPFVSKLLKLQHHTYVIIEGTGKRILTSVPNVSYSFQLLKRKGSTNLVSSNVKKPKNLVGLPPETRVVIQVSLEPLQPGLVEVASITLNTSDSESSPPQN